MHGLIIKRKPRVRETENNLTELQSSLQVFLCRVSSQISQHRAAPNKAMLRMKGRLLSSPERFPAIQPNGEVIRMIPT